MKERKPRVKKQEQRMSEICMYYDGQYPDGYHSHECFLPWNTKCDGNKHKCFKLKMQWLASLPNDKRETMQNKYSL